MSSVLASTAKEFAKERLKDATEAVSPMDLADEYGCTNGHMRNCLADLVEKGVADRAGRGKYISTQVENEEPAQDYNMRSDAQEPAEDDHSDDESAQASDDVSDDEPAENMTFSTDPQDAEGHAEVSPDMGSPQIDASEIENDGDSLEQHAENEGAASETHSETIDEMADSAEGGDGDRADRPDDPDPLRPEFEESDRADVDVDELQDVENDQADAELEEEHWFECPSCGYASDYESLQEIVVDEAPAEDDLDDGEDGTGSIGLPSPHSNWEIVIVLSIIAFLAVVFWNSRKDSQEHEDEETVDLSDPDQSIIT